MLFRQEIEIKQCIAYGQVNQHHDLPTRNLRGGIEMRECIAYGQVNQNHEFPTRNLRQESEMKQCIAYDQVNGKHDLPTKQQNVDCSADYEWVGENDDVYEKIFEES